MTVLTMDREATDLAVSQSSDMDRSEEESTLILDYIRRPMVLSLSQTNKEVQSYFEKEGVECAVVCQQNHIPIGLVMKDRLFRHLGKTFGASLFYRQSITKLMEINPLIVEQSVPVQSIIDQALNRCEDSLYDCIIITNEQKLIGIVTVGDLLNISRILQKKSVEEQIKIVMKSKQMMEKINESIHQVTESTSNGKNVSESMMETTKEGSSQLKKILGAFERYSELTFSQENQIRELEKSMKSAKEIIEVIRELANQLNVLSVNASIEAAHAKENGESFSIVANEVKRLSGETKSHVEEIQDKLKMVQNCVNSTVSLVEAGHNETMESSHHVIKTNDIFENLFMSITENGNSVNQNYNYARSAAIEASLVMQSMNELILGMKTANKIQIKTFDDAIV